MKTQQHISSEFRAHVKEETVDKLLDWVENALNGDALGTHMVSPMTFYDGLRFDLIVKPIRVGREMAENVAERNKERVINGKPQRQPAKSHHTKTG